MLNQIENKGKLGKKYTAMDQSENLDFAWNNIGDSEAKEIAEVLKFNKSLTTLNLRGNNIGASGAKEIIEHHRRFRSEGNRRSVENQQVLDKS